MIVWTAKHPQFHPDMLGYIQTFLDEDDPRPAREQIAERYVSGWRPLSGFTLAPDGSLLYPNDPPTIPLAECKLRNETLRFYDCEWLAIIQEDGSFEVARLD